MRSLPKGYTRGRIHPATRTFQALRIAVNEELEALSLGLEVCFRMLKKGGRLCVISFHSLEDRLVKNKFKSLGFQQEGIILTKRPLVASDEECAANPRSRSAKMRAIERTEMSLKVYFKIAIVCHYNSFVVYSYADEDL